MRKIALLLMSLAMLFVGSSAADYYATKADYRAGKLTPGPPLPKGSGSSCRDDLVEICENEFIREFDGDTSGCTRQPMRCELDREFHGPYTWARDVLLLRRFLLRPEHPGWARLRTIHIHYYRRWVS